VGRARRTGGAGGPWAWRGRWRVTLGGASEGLELKGLLNFLSATLSKEIEQHDNYNELLCTPRWSDSSILACARPFKTLPGRLSSFLLIPSPVISMWYPQKNPQL
jgi:hypothetical protein